jgi:hypothetical protein
MFLVVLLSSIALPHTDILQETVLLVTHSWRDSGALHIKCSSLVLGIQQCVVTRLVLAIWYLPVDEAKSLF